MFISAYLLSEFGHYLALILWELSSMGELQVELQTLDGLVKDRTQCAPNGYYFIPVYDKVYNLALVVFL